MRSFRIGRHLVALALLAVVSSLTRAQRGGANSPFPGGENPDGSLKPTARLTRLFSQDAYTEYALLEPGSEQFRIRYLTEEPRAGSTELVNATRGGSEGTDVEVYDPRTGKPMQFTYEIQGETHAIHAKFATPVPQGAIGRVLIYKTYKDPRTYQVYNEASAQYGIQPGDISWVRSLAGYRLGVILPKGFAFLSSNVAAQMSTLADGRIELHFANPSGLSNPLTIHARKTTATLAPTPPYTDMFFDDVKTLYDLGAPESHTMKVEQIYSDYRRGDKLPVDLLGYAALKDVVVTDLDTARPLATSKQGSTTMVKLEVPIENDKQSAHLKVTGTLDDGYKFSNDVLTFDRPLKGLRNTILLPAGFDVTSMSQSGTVGIYQGRVFVAFVNLNAENSYHVVITASKRK